MKELKNIRNTDPFSLQELEFDLIGKTYKFCSTKFDNIKSAIEQFVEDMDGKVDKSNSSNGFRFIDKKSDVIIEINFYRKNDDIYIIEFHKPFAYHTKFEFNIVINKLIDKIKIFFLSLVFIIPTI